MLRKAPTPFPSQSNSPMQHTFACSAPYSYYAQRGSDSRFNFYFSLLFKRQKLFNYFAIAELKKKKSQLLEKTSIIVNILLLFFKWHPAVPVQIDFTAPATADAQISTSSQTYSYRQTKWMKGRRRRNPKVASPSYSVAAWKTFQLAWPLKAFLLTPPRGADQKPAAERHMVGVQRVNWKSKKEKKKKGIKEHTME